MMNLNFICLLTGLCPLSWLKPVISAFFFFYSADHLEEKRITWKSSVNVNPFWDCSENNLWEIPHQNTEIQKNLHLTVDLFYCSWKFVKKFVTLFPYFFLIISGKYKIFHISLLLITNKTNRETPKQKPDQIPQAPQYFSLKEVLLCLYRRHRELI